MKTPNVWILAGVVLLLLFGIGVAWAMSSAGFNLVKNTNEGGGAGGNLGATSQHQLVNSVQGAVQVDSFSSGYRLCSGFLCGSTPVIALPTNTPTPTITPTPTTTPSTDLNLPLVIKDFPP